MSADIVHVEVPQNVGDTQLIQVMDDHDLVSKQP